MYTVLIETLLCVTLVTAATIEEKLNKYSILRRKLAELEANRYLGGNITLNEEEIKVNDILMKLKEEEDNSAFYHPDNFNFTKHYFEYKDYINGSKLYHVIKKMPKGAALHVHETFLMDADYLLNLTYENHLYACDINNIAQFHYAENKENIPVRNRTFNCDSIDNWALVSDLRQASSNVTAFDRQLRKQFTLICDKEDYCPTQLNEVWDRFRKIHNPIKSLLNYRSVREKFLYDSFKRFYDDNVMYIEIRTGIHRLYELNGTWHDDDYTISLHRDVTNKFIEDHPDFIGIKLIITKHRNANVTVVEKVLNLTKQFKKHHPDLIAGFDLVGQEDKGRPLSNFMRPLLASKGKIDYFFHAGETDWFGTATDNNLLDAIILDTKRIGHGYALDKHPVLLDMIKLKDIAVEVNVISNAVLDLVDDMREHPLANFLSQNVPVVLSSDDPGVWGAEPLSHDFYVSFMAVASRRSDLRVLKQLALNSIRYSALDSERKGMLENVFEKRWKEFLFDILNEHNTRFYDVISQQRKQRDKQDRKHYKRILEGMN